VINQVGCLANQGAPILDKRGDIGEGSGFQQRRPPSTMPWISHLRIAFRVRGKKYHCDLLSPARDFVRSALGLQ